MVELITESRMAIDDLVNAMGRATIETVLQLSAEQVAGPPQQGRRRAEGIFWHGKQAGSVYLKERKLKVHKPRLRKKGGGVQAEVAVPAYEAMQDCWPVRHVNRPKIGRPPIGIRGADVHGTVPNYRRAAIQAERQQTLLRPFFLISHSVVRSESPFQDNCKHRSG